MLLLTLPSFWNASWISSARACSEKNTTRVLNRLWKPPSTSWRFKTVSCNLRRALNNRYPVGEGWWWHHQSQAGVILRFNRPPNIHRVYRKTAASTRTKRITSFRIVFTWTINFMQYAGMIHLPLPAYILVSCADGKSLMAEKDVSCREITVWEVNFHACLATFGNNMSHVSI